MKKKENLELENIFEQINIVRGDKILVSSSILGMLIKSKKKNEKFDANLFIDLLLNKIGSEGTLIFPTYNWDFCKGKIFDYNKSKSMSGALGNFALNRSDFQRTINPIYSFAVSGKDKNYICNLNHHSCFGLDSPFGYLIKNKGKNLFVGIDYKEGFTFIHNAEEAVGVNYRYFKKFSGIYIDKFNNKKTVKYKMYVRNLRSNIIQTAISEKFDEVLINKKAYVKKILQGTSFITIDINKAYKAVLDDLKTKGGLIYPKTN